MPEFRKLTEFIRGQANEYLSRDKSGKGFICPICGSGSGKNGTGITTKDRVHFTCWAGCFKNSDVIDIIGKKYGLEDFQDKLKKAAEIFNIDTPEGDIIINKKNKTKESKGNRSFSLKADKDQDSAKSMPVNSKFSPCASFFLEANKNLNKTDYHRGISLETLNRFRIGFVENWRHPNFSRQTPLTPRLIIPTSENSYLARDTRPELDIPEAQRKYIKQKVGGSSIFNSQALVAASQPIFVVEGELDALSIIDVGGEAVGLGSLTNVDKLIELLEINKPQQPLILLLDDDEAGRSAKSKLSNTLKGLKFAFYEPEESLGYKDPNEALNANIGEFRGFVDRVKNMSQEKIKAESVFYSLENFLETIKKPRTVFISTGFKDLDNLLDGGLSAGLYVVGAISSLGKTTFVSQIADKAAMQDQDVLFFSLEMSKNELIAKSISRLTYQRDRTNAKTARGILMRYNSCGAYERDLIKNSVDDYKKFAKHLYIHEGAGNIGTEEIKQKVENHIKITGIHPVVVIDYLQILAPYDIRATEKQNIDKSVLELKRLSRDNNLPVIGISSFNRLNYTTPVNMASFKESGAIEYSSDCLIGLQFEGMDYVDCESEKDRSKRVQTLVRENIENGKTSEKPQKIQAKILKQRNGSKGDVFLDFWPKFNYFADAKESQRLTEYSQKELDDGFASVNSDYASY